MAVIELNASIKIRISRHARFIIRLFFYWQSYSLPDTQTKTHSDTLIKIRQKQINNKRINNVKTLAITNSI